MNIYSANVLIFFYGVIIKCKIFINKIINCWYYKFITIIFWIYWIEKFSEEISGIIIINWLNPLTRETNLVIITSLLTGQGMSKLINIWQIKIAWYTYTCYRFYIYHTLCIVEIKFLFSWLLPRVLYNTPNKFSSLYQIYPMQFQYYYP